MWLSTLEKFLLQNFEKGSIIFVHKSIYGIMRPEKSGFILP